MCNKTLLIDEYFKDWRNDLDKAAELLEQDRYHLEGILVLSCYLGAFAAMRFRELQDGEAYVRTVREYSGKRDFFDQIDLLFFWQWPRSKLRDKGNYKALKQHSEIVAALMNVYGDEDDIKVGTRYVYPGEFVSHVKAAEIPEFDESNLRENLPLFSLAELLYRYLRCDAVHNADFPFLNKTTDIDGNVSYKSNHAITGQIVLETARGVHNTLWRECRGNDKWPHEL